MQHKVTCVLAIVLMLVFGTLAQGQTETTCTVAPRDRINCGYPGVTPTECKAKGCCFDSAVRGHPWCFYPNTVQEPAEEECPF